ncbi:MAG: ABC transporter substrate-binding protein, partial [Eubacterium sp.]|nr:ABC transporter substrate-binding protein [Eubacterium sp.]
IESFTDQTGYTMVKNENYREDVPYDKVNIMFMGDASAKTMALQSGQIDLAENITNVADLDKFKADDNFTVDIASGVRCGFAWMNFNGILKNETLRQAIVMGVDKEAICTSNLINGLYTAGFSVLPSTLSYGYDKLNNPYAYDVEAAKKLLDDAGIVDSDGDGIRELDGQNINLKYVSYENRSLNDFADAQTQYLTALGIGVTADYGSSDDQWSKLVAGEYDLNNNNWSTVANGDPTEYMANWYSKSEGNYCGYSNEKYDELYEKLSETSDADARADLFQQMQQILVDDAVVLVDGYYNSSMIYSKNVGYAHIHTADYYWLSTEITPAQ